MTRTRKFSLIISIIIQIVQKESEQLVLHVLITGMCLGGHLAFRCAFDPRVSACVSYFATDIHSESLAFGKNSDSLIRCREIKGELLMIFGKQVHFLV